MECDTGRSSPQHAADGEQPRDCSQHSLFTVVCSVPKVRSACSIVIPSTLDSRRLDTLEEEEEEVEEVVVEKDE